jgi:hypothetical protein
MSLCVILNNQLKGSLPDPNKYARKKATTETKENVPIWEQFISESEHPESNYLEQTNNGLINTFLFAYNNHIPLKVKVQDIHIALQLIISTFVNNNAEQCRKMFVDHSGKKKLTVENDKIDFNVFGQMMRDEVKKNVKDCNFVDLLEPNYSTTKPICMTVSNLLVLNTLKEYFSYNFVCRCGIPEVVLEGSQDDWMKLKGKYDEMKRMFYNSRSNELDDWFDCMDIIMNMFIEMRMIGTEGTVEATDAQKMLWERVISFVPVGSGGDTLLGGWISILSPYSSENKIKHVVKNLPCLDTKTMVPKEDGINYYEYQRVLGTYYGGTGWNNLQTTMFLTPAVLDLYGVEYNIEMTAGFSPYVHVSEQKQDQDNNKFIVETNMMYMIMREVKDMQNTDLVTDESEPVQQIDSQQSSRSKCSIS